MLMSHSMGGVYGPASYNHELDTNLLGNEYTYEMLDGDRSITLISK